MHSTPPDDVVFTLGGAFKLFRILLRKWWLLGAVGGIATVATFLLLSIQPPQFSSEAVLVQTSTVGSDRKPDSNDVTNMMARRLTVQDYQIIATSDSLLKQLRAKTEWHTKGGKPVPMDVLRRKLIAKTTVIKDTRINIEHSPVLKLGATEQDANLSATIASAWAELLVEASKSYARSSATGLKAFYEAEFNESAADYDRKIAKSSNELDALRQQLVELQAEMTTEMMLLKNTHAQELSKLEAELDRAELERRILSLKTILADQEHSLQLLTIQAAGKRQLVETLNQEVATLPDRIVLNKGLTDTALALSGSPDFPEANRSVVVEIQNPVYTSAVERLSVARGALEELSQQLQEVTLEIANNRRAWDETQNLLEDGNASYENRVRENSASEENLQNSFQREVGRLEELIHWTSGKINGELESQGEVYSELNVKAMSARLAEAESEPDLRVLVSPQVSVQPLPRGRGIRSLSAGVLATVLAALLLLAREGFVFYAATDD